MGEGFGGEGFRALGAFLIRARVSGGKVFFVFSYRPCGRRALRGELACLKKRCRGKRCQKTKFVVAAVRAKEADGPEGGRFFGFGGLLCLGEGFWEGQCALYFHKDRVDEGRLEENWPVSKRGFAKNVAKKLNLVDYIFGDFVIKLRPFCQLLGFIKSKF